MPEVADGGVSLHVKPLATANETTMSPDRPRRARLLISVRSAQEADEACAGGADLIDVKEPARGPLGRASDRVMREVLAHVAGRLPVSAAGGEWLEPLDELPPPPGLAYWKRGLSGCAGRDWSSAVLAHRDHLPAPTEPVLVAYADWQRAGSVPPTELSQFAQDHSFRVFLVDTWGKDGSTLLDWLPLTPLAELTGSLQSRGVSVALAGSLGLREIEALRPVAPDWFAVRGAACTGGRGGTVDRCRVAALAEWIRCFPEPVKPRHGS